MLEFSLVLLVMGAVFFFLWHKLSKDHAEFEKDENTPAPFMAQINRFSCFVLGIVFLYSAFYFAMLGDPSVTTSINGTGCGTAELSSYGYANLTTEEVVFACSVGTMNWSAYPTVVCNDQLAVLSSEYHLTVAPYKVSDSINTTTTACNSSEVKTTSYSAGQFSMAVAIYTVLQQLFILYALVWFVILFLRFFKGIEDAWKKKQEGNFD